MNFPAWSKPVGVAADKTQSRIARLKAYRDTHTTVLANGVRPNPTLATMSMVLDVFDTFNATLALEVGGYTIHLTDLDREV